MEAWKIESNPLKQTVVNWAVIAAGVILVYGFRDFDSSGFTNSLAGFLLGVLLLIVGIPALIMIARQTITVDPVARQILIEDESRWGKKVRSIAFHEIAEASVSRLGSRSDGSVSYYVTLRLVSGETYPLFFPAYYDGRWDRSVAEDRCRRLEGYLGQH